MRKRLVWLVAIGGLGSMAWLLLVEEASEQPCVAKGRIWDAHHGACLNETYPRALGYLE